MTIIWPGSPRSCAAKATDVELPIREARRYVQPLREGGSLPAVVHTDEGPWVVKFRGAGQGPKALLAELLVGLLGTAAGLPVPDLALVHVAPAFGRTEGDPEIQDILRASHGLNVGLRYLDGAFNFDQLAAGDLIDPEFAADLVWFDALVTNPDRTARNPNLMIWQRRPWLIDHGAALYAHHDWSRVDEAKARAPFPLIRDHVLLAKSADLRAADARMAARLDADTVARAVALLPDDLLTDRGEFATGDEARARYADYLTARLDSPRAFLEEAIERKEELLRAPPRRMSSRR